MKVTSPKARKIKNFRHLRGTEEAPQTTHTTLPNFLVLAKWSYDGREGNLETLEYRRMLYISGACHSTARNMNNLDIRAAIFSHARTSRGSSRLHRYKVRAVGEDDTRFVAFPTLLEAM